MFKCVCVGGGGLSSGILFWYPSTLFVVRKLSQFFCYKLLFHYHYHILVCALHYSQVCDFLCPSHYWNFWIDTWASLFLFFRISHYIVLVIKCIFLHRKINNNNNNLLYLYRIAQLVTLTSLHCGPVVYIYTDMMCRNTLIAFTYITCIHTLTYTHIHTHSINSTMLNCDL